MNSMPCAVYALGQPYGISIAKGSPAFRTPLMFCPYPEVCTVRRLLPALAVIVVLSTAVAVRADDLPIGHIEKTDQAQQAGDTAWMLVVYRAGAAHGAGVGPVLRRHGPAQERPRHDDAQHGRAGASSAFNGCCSATAWRSANRKGGFIGWTPDFLGLGRALPRCRLARHEDSRSLSTACIRECSPSSRRR